MLILSEQQQKLKETLRGHDAYYGVTSTSGTLVEVHFDVAILYPLSDGGEQVFHLGLLLGRLDHLGP